MAVYDKIQYGDRTTAKSTKNSKNKQKLPQKSQNQVKKYVILHFIKGVPFKIMTMRTQPYNLPHI